jgi:hypothetical protein
MPPSFARTAQYGLAIAVDRIVAVPEDTKCPIWTDTLHDPPGDDDWPELIASLERFRAMLCTAPAAVSVALMPGLAQVRPIELPFMRKGELQRVIQRDATSFFFRARGELVVAIRHLNRTSRRRAIIAAAAPRWLLEMLAENLTTATVCLHQVVPAHAAWASGADRVPHSRPKGGWLQIQHGQVLDLVEIKAGTIRQLRRVRATGDEALITSITGASAASGSVIGPDSAMITAARHAQHAQSLALVPPSVAAADERRASRSAGWLIAAAALLLAVNGGLRIRDVDKELEHVRQTRALVSREVVSVLRTQSRVSRIEQLLTLLCSDREATPVWSNVIVTLAMHLPVDSHVLKLEAAGDSVILEGQSDSASDAIAQLRRAPGVSAVHARAPIRIDDTGESDRTEYFSIVLRLAPRADRTTER